MPISTPETRSPIILIDESLADRALTGALMLVDYNAIASTQQFGAGTPDPQIIQWLGFQGGLWVTADEDAKRKHSQLIRGSAIHILWIRQPPRSQGFPKKAQLLLILYVIDPVLAEIKKSRSPMQFIAKFSGQRPKWERI